MRTTASRPAAASLLLLIVIVGMLTGACAKLPPARVRPPTIIQAPPSAVYDAVLAQFRDTHTAILLAQPATGVVTTLPMGLSSVEGRFFASCVSVVRARVPADRAVYHASVRSGPDSTSAILSSLVDWTGTDMTCVTTGEWERWFEDAVQARVLGKPVPPYDPDGFLIRVREAARLYAAPDAGSKVLHRFFAATDVFFLSADGEWVHVRFGDRDGYVLARDTRR